MLTKNIDTMKAEVAYHIQADAVLAGQYWNDGKGCFIGCLAHSNDVSKVAERFNIPEPSLRIAEHIFERLSHQSKQKGVQFFHDVPDAIEHDGKDLSLVHLRFAKDVLEHLSPQSEKIQSVIDPVIAGLGLLIEGKDWPDAAAYAAAYAAADAARAVAYAARASAYAAYAAADASAYAAADAAACAAACAAHATGDASAVASAVARDRAAEIERQKTVFLKLLKEAPIPQRIGSMTAIPVGGM